MSITYPILCDSLSNRLITGHCRLFSQFENENELGRKDVRTPGVVSSVVWACARILTCWASFEAVTEWATKMMSIDMTFLSGAYDMMSDYKVIYNRFIIKRDGYLI